MLEAVPGHLQHLLAGVAAPSWGWPVLTWPKYLICSFRLVSMVMREVMNWVTSRSTCFWLGLSLATSDRALPAVWRQDTTSFSTLSSWSILAIGSRDILAAQTLS